MKKMLVVVSALLLALVLASGLTACGKKNGAGSVWENAVYKEDTEFGSGTKTVICEVKVGVNTVTFTIHTDETTVGAALTENGLIEGEEGAYGLYIKKVNGITADYDVDQSYWAFNIDGEFALTGVDTTEITEGIIYQLVYTK